MTEKREAAKKEAEQQKRAKEIRTKVIAFGVPALVVIALTLGIIFGGSALGWWDEKPVATEHAAISVEDYGSLHVELYGEHAPETVKHFLDLVNSNRYNGIKFDKLKDGKLETTAINASSTVKGEFADNGIENIVPFKRGTLVMALANGNDSANGEFFILTEDMEELEGKYAAFGRVTDLSVLDAIVEDLEPAEDGSIPLSSRPKITDISTHAHH